MAAPISGDTIRYSYAPGNKRVWRGSGTVDELTYYSAGGAKLVAYNLSASGSNLRAVSMGYSEYFGGKLLKNAQGWVNQDRLGSIGKYFPYGEERPSATANGKEKFATYTRDAETGLDYAQNRYHSAGQGRFLTADPYQASAGVDDPGSWNRYAYVGGDPLNRTDPGGLCWIDNLNPNAVYGLAAQGYSYEDLCYKISFDLGDIGDGSLFSPGFLPGGFPGQMVGEVGLGILLGLPTPNRPSNLRPTPPTTTPPTSSPSGRPGLGPPSISVPFFIGITIGKLIATTFPASPDPGGQTLNGQRFMNPRDLEAECTKVGGPVTAPSVQYPGGQSWEQEYECPDGTRWTIHRLYDKNGTLQEEHSRPKGPKYGPRR